MRWAYHVVSFVLAACCVSRITVAQETPEGAAPSEQVNSPTTSLPRSEDSVPSQTSVPPTPPTNPGPGTILPQGSPNPQPYPYPYYPYPYPPGHPGAYPQSWAARPPTKKTTWYGWQTLIGVVAGDIITVIGNTSNVEPLAFVGVGGHVLTGPIVHWVHGHVGKGFASLGLNVGLPGLGLLSGYALGSGNSYASLAFMLIFGGIGYIAAPTLDMSLLSTETVDETTTPRGARALLPSSVGLMPMLDQHRRGLMLVGQF